MDRTDWVEHFLHVVDEHVDAEGEILESYRDASARIVDPTVTYLVDAIVDDERRHHELLRGLRDRVAGTAGGSPARLSDEDHGVLASLTARMLKVERRDLEEIHDLRNSLEKVRRTGPWDRLRDVLRTARVGELGEHDREALEDVHADLAMVDDTVLWSLVLRILELDTQKHIEILSALEDAVTARGATPATGPVDL